jgi:hypothetical protein
MFAGVRLFPEVFSKALELQNGMRGGTFRCRAKNMNDFLGNRSVFSLRARLNLSIQAIRQILDIQGRHRFLQNASIMEETAITVKFFGADTDKNDGGPTADVGACDQSQSGEADRFDHTS